MSGQAHFPALLPHESSARVAVCGGRGVAWSVVVADTREHQVAGLDITTQGSSGPRTRKQRACDPGSPLNCKPARLPKLIHYACVGVVVG
jgi:NAD-dependent oxidoreductase involved in siderophore biosynthesis